MKKLLIANRGEIACRIIRTARHMGIKTVSVYSEPDRDLPHVRYADEAACLGPANAAESYLNIDKILQVADKHNVDAIHPGYGFLSENAAFAERVAAQGLIFVGPGAEAIRVMGDKLKAKAAVKAYGIPLLPGTDGAITDIPKAEKEAAGIGFPILIKAAAGGGGKGMRVVENEADFRDEMKRAQSEAKASFGDDSVFIEKYIASPKHIEVQILADQHGNISHLFERECSVQRRHQKVIEEAPSPVVNEEIRARLGESAVDVARACNYVGAGTVEFIMDENRDFFFLEMNTRLQVEHPVTELITGTDLVKEQIQIARGEKLTFSHENLTINGHAIELRVYAEDPADNFLPSTGKLHRYRPPKGPGVRVDDGFDEGSEVMMHYDPMIAKLITHGANREEAIARMLLAIEEYEIEGPSTTLPFGKFVLNHPEFINGNFNTHFVQQYFTPDKMFKPTEKEQHIAALMSVIALAEKEENVKTSVQNSIARSNWKNNRNQ